MKYPKTKPKRSNSPVRGHSAATRVYAHKRNGKKVKTSRPGKPAYDKESR